MMGLVGGDTRIWDAIVTDLGWEDARTAHLYDEFTREFPMYEETSRDLVALSGVDEATTIVDLACGTGVTTRALLEIARQDGVIFAIDGSRAMLDRAKRNVRDARVRWIHADASSLADHAHAADLIVCNSALWQTDMPAVFAAAARALTPEGRFAFNIGRHFIRLPFTPEETSRQKPSLAEYIQAIATLDHDYVQPFAPRGGRPLSKDVIESMLTDAGLRLQVFEIMSYESTPSRQHAWFKVPIFANNLLTGMPYEQQIEVLDKAYEKVDRSAVEQSRWAYFVARPA